MPQNGSFVLYRLFNKQDQETPASNSESPGNPSQATASVLEDDTSQSGSSQLTATNMTTDHSSTAHHLTTTTDDAEQTAAQAQEAAFLDVLTQLPDLQAKQIYDGFPTISSPMRPYTDLPFVGNMGDEQDFSPYLDSIIAEQDLQDMLLSPAYAETVGTGNAVSNPTAAVTFCSASSGSWTPYPQHLLLDSLVEPNPNASHGQGGWAAAPSTQQSTDPEFMDEQQGTAARRIRLLLGVERASASQPILTCHSGSEDEAESCCSIGSSSGNHDEDHRVNPGCLTMEDVLHARVRTNGVVEIQFSPLGESKRGGEVYRLYDVGGQRNERRKWIHLFEGVDAIIFCAAISEYDQLLFEDETQNRMMETKELFDWVLKQRCFEKTSFMLFLNKFDIFERKIQKVSLTVCEWFKDYEPIAPGKVEDVEHAYEFVKKKFEEVYFQSSKPDHVDRVFKIYRTTALDQKLVKKTFKLIDESMRRSREGTGT